MKDDNKNNNVKDGNIKDDMKNDMKNDSKDNKDDMNKNDKKDDDKDESSFGNMKKAATGAAVGAGAAVAAAVGWDKSKNSSKDDMNNSNKDDMNNSNKDKKVSIDESANKTKAVGGEKKGEPKKLERLPQGSKIAEYREKNEVAAEGLFYKKRVIFACFWHPKYFVLLKSGILLYHKADGSRAAKGNWNIKNATNFKTYDYENAWVHPFRFVLSVDDVQLYFGYETKEERDYWYEVLEKMSHS
ncbi:hypothetical protein ENBRE01_2088 [Enteropsectra breve]|nr:hypothetical protein ENBRE01_2088 [Enteropsectra breve]